MSAFRRYVSLLRVADILALKQTKPRNRRRAALSAIRKVEKHEGVSYLVRRGREYLVSVRALEMLVANDEIGLSAIEQSVAELNAKERHLTRQLNAHGARIRNLEKWRELTEQYLAACQQIKGHRTAND